MSFGVHSGTKSTRTFHKYCVKEVRAVSGAELDWLGRSTDSCFQSADAFTALPYKSENFYVNVNEVCLPY